MASICDSLSCDASFPVRLRFAASSAPYYHPFPRSPASYHRSLNVKLQRLRRLSPWRSKRTDTFASRAPGPRELLWKEHGEVRTFNVSKQRFRPVTVTIAPQIMRQTWLLVHNTVHLLRSYQPGVLGAFTLTSRRAHPCLGLRDVTDHTRKGKSPPAKSTQATVYRSVVTLVCKQHE